MSKDDVAVVESVVVDDTRAVDNSVVEVVDIDEAVEVETIVVDGFGFFDVSLFLTWNSFGGKSTENIVPTITATANNTKTICRQPVI